jgi:hypothetical protein
MTDVKINLHVHPIYGWGWFDSKTTSLEVPEPFDLVVSIIEKGNLFKTALGHVDTANHPLFGLWILLLRRHGTDYTLMAFKEKPDVLNISQESSHLTGYVTITESSN